MLYACQKANGSMLPVCLYSNCAYIQTRFSSCIPRSTFCSSRGDPAFAQVNSAAFCGFGEVFLHVDLFVANQFVAVLSYRLAF